MRNAGASPGQSRLESMGKGEGQMEERQRRRQDFEDQRMSSEKSSCLVHPGSEGPREHGKGRGVDGCTGPKRERNTTLKISESIRHARCFEFREAVS